MFKIGSFEDELLCSMEKSLINSQVEQKYSFDKLTKAANYLNAAADLFEKAGMNNEASKVIEVLQQLTNKFSGKPSSL